MEYYTMWYFTFHIYKLQKSKWNLNHFIKATVIPIKVRAFVVLRKAFFFSFLLFLQCQAYQFPCFFSRGIVFGNFCYFVSLHVFCAQYEHFLYCLNKLPFYMSKEQNNFNLILDAGALRDNGCGWWSNSREKRCFEVTVKPFSAIHFYVFISYMQIYIVNGKNIWELYKGWLEKL